MTKFDKAFKSELDKFLENFDRQYPERSLSQREEVKKSAQISELAGFPAAQNKTGNIR